MHHPVHRGEEPDPVLLDLPRFTADECALFDDLRDNRIHRDLGLEQERAGFQWVARSLAKLTGQMLAWPAVGCDGPGRPTD